MDLAPAADLETPNLDTSNLSWAFFFFFKSQGMFFYTSEMTEIDKTLSPLFY